MDLTPNERSVAYDRIYDAASEVINRLKPCDIQFNADGKATCFAIRQDPKYGNPGTLCCAGCKHLTPTGCSG